MVAKTQQAISKSPLSNLLLQLLGYVISPILWLIKGEKIFLAAGPYAEIGSVGYHNMVKRVLVGYGIDVDAVSGWCVLRTISSMQ